jgi:hypothetical protein
LSLGLKARDENKSLFAQVSVVELDPADFKQTMSWAFNTLNGEAMNLPL